MNKKKDYFEENSQFTLTQERSTQKQRSIMEGDTMMELVKSR